MKGISNIITSVLLVAISIAVVGAYSEWAPSFAESITEQTGEDIESDMSCSNADFRIDNVMYSSSSGEVFIDLVNSGTITFHEDLNVYALESSSIIAEKEVSRLEVDDTSTVDLFTDFEEPESIMVSSQECPDLSRETSNIREYQD